VVFNVLGLPQAETEKEKILQSHPAGRESEPGAATVTPRDHPSFQLCDWGLGDHFEQRVR
jgi:hypothetical protein